MNFRQIYIVVSLLAMAAIMSACGGSTHEQAKNAQLAAGIVGGKMADESQDAGYWAVAQLELEPDDSLCSGVLISENLILTAAHCVSDISSSKIGSAFFPQAGDQRIRIKKMIVHPDYGSNNDEDENFNSIGTNQNDLAILQLARPVAAPLMAVPLAQPNSVTKPDSVRVRIYGFGRKYMADDEDPELRFADLTGSLNLSKGRIEFPRSKSGTCKGDSGGPSFLISGSDVRVAGITSYRYGYNRYASDKCKSATHSMWVPSHLSWIRKTMQALSK